MSDADRIAALEARIAELEARVNPPPAPKFEVGELGPTTSELAIRMAGRIPREVTEAMVAAVPDGAIREIVGDGRTLAKADASFGQSAGPRSAGTGVLRPLKSGYQG